MDESALIASNHTCQIDKLSTVWHSLSAVFSLEQRIDLVFPLLFLRLASIHADEELAETADICWTELSESETPVATYESLRSQLAHPHTWAEADIFVALPALTAQHEASLQKLLNALQELDMYALQYRDIGEFWESCLQQCVAPDTAYARLCPPAALINTLVALLQPQPEQHFYAPVAGSGSFLVAALDYVQMLLEERDSLPPEHTCRVSAQVHSALEQRLCLANLRLHDMPMSDLYLRRAGSATIPQAVDVVFANFCGLEKNVDITDLLRSSLACLTAHGHALLLLPDDYLRAAEWADWRRECLQHYQLHTLLRLPKGLLSSDSSALFISHTGATESLWVYDLRTQIGELSMQNEQLANILGHFTLAYGEDPLANTQKRQARAAKDARLRLWHLNELNEDMDLTPDWLSHSSTDLPPLSTPPKTATKAWRGLLNETLQDLHQLGTLLHHDDKI